MCYSIRWPHKLLHFLYIFILYIILIHSWNIVWIKVKKKRLKPKWLVIPCLWKYYVLLLSKETNWHILSSLRKVPLATSQVLQTNLNLQLLPKEVTTLNWHNTSWNITEPWNKESRTDTDGFNNVQSRLVLSGPHKSKQSQYLTGPHTSYEECNLLHQPSLTGGRKANRGWN